MLIQRRADMEGVTWTVVAEFLSLPQEMRNTAPKNPCAAEGVKPLPTS
jgi:hypothetical protein